MAVSTLERSTPTPVAQENPPPPPLNSGDRLTRAQFERIYAAHPEIKKAELIEGVVYVPSPTRHREHGKPHFHTIGWLNLYSAATPGVEGSDNATLRLDFENEPATRRPPTPLAGVRRQFQSWRGRLPGRRA